MSPSRHRLGRPTLARPAPSLRRPLLLPVLVLAVMLATPAWAGEYCEDFENGDLGEFWRQSFLDNGAKWQPSSYQELKKTIPQFPEPASGDTVVYLTPKSVGQYGSARLVMSDAYDFPDGSSIYFRYWLQSQYSQSGTLELRKVVGTTEEPDYIYSLTDQSGPDVLTWNEVNITVPAGKDPFKLMIFAACTSSFQDNIAIDDISVYGPTELKRTCGVTTTTTPEPTTTTTPTTTTEPTTTPEPTTTSPTTTTEPTTTPVPTTTTTQTTTTEPTTTQEPTTPAPSTTTPEPTTTPAPTTTPEPTTTTERTTTPEPTTAAPVTTTESATTTEPTETTRPPTTPATPTSELPTSTTDAPAPTGPGHIDDRRYGPSGLLWVVFVVLGSSMVLALMLALTRQRRRQDDRLALVQDQDRSGSASGSSGWYDYLASDRWRNVKTRLSELMSSLT